MNQAALDRVRVINKHFTNKILIHISGRKFGHFAILHHIGRKSGRHYRIPIIAEPLDGAFVFALTYGKNVDWYKNVVANGGCSLQWKNKEFNLIHPELVDRDTALQAFPRIFQKALRKVGIQYYLKLEVSEVTPDSA